MRSVMNFSPAWMGTPTVAQMSACTSITLSSLVRPQPSGWWVYTASICVPFSRSLSASMISAGFMSMPPRMVVTSVSGSPT